MSVFVASREFNFRLQRAILSFSNVLMSGSVDSRKRIGTDVWTEIERRVFSKKESAFFCKCCDLRFLGCSSMLNLMKCEG